MTTSSIIQLSDFKSLFKSDSAYEEMIQMLESRVENEDIQLVSTDNKVLFTAVPFNSMKEFLCARIVNRFAESPELIDELRDRIENDEIVD